MEKNQQIQQKYYAETASNYDDWHLNHESGEHDFALMFLSSAIERLGSKSVLDVGAGTGRTINYLKSRHPDIQVTGIEPVKELREQGYKKGIEKENLIEGYGENIAFPDNSFDIVCEFGILHHVPQPEKVVEEMLRVARKGIFISDSNNFGQGSWVARTIKQGLNALGAWRLYDFVRTRGKMYQISEGDGLFYSYSVFNNYRQIKKSCKVVHLVNTKDGSSNLYKTASHIALLGIKKEG